MTSTCLYSSRFQKGFVPHPLSPSFLRGARVVTSAGNQDDHILCGEVNYTPVTKSRRRPQAQAEAVDEPLK